MTRLQVLFEDVIEDYPEIVEEFLNILRDSNSIYNDIDIAEIEWYYTWEFKYETSDVDDDFSRFELMYDDRFMYELDSVKVNVIRKAGEFRHQDRVNSYILPVIVIDLVDEIVKIMMIEEQKFFSNSDIIDTIPPLSTTFGDIAESFNMYKQYVESSVYDGYDRIISDDDTNDEDVEPYDYTKYNLDIILDKITSSGMKSLTNGGP